MDGAPRVGQLEDLEAFNTEAQSFPALGAAWRGSIRPRLTMRDYVQTETTYDAATGTDV